MDFVVYNVFLSVKVWIFNKFLFLVFNYFGNIDYLFLRLYFIKIGFIFYCLGCV